MPKPKVFICWSGDASRQVAAALRTLIGHVLQTVEPFMSDKDIRSGAEWPRVLREQLSEATYGIVCVTHENKDSTWIHFEAGALLHKLAQQAVCPYLIDLEATDLKPPLGHLQGRKADDTDTLRLLLDVNAASPAEIRVPEDNVRAVFGAMWEKDAGSVVKAVVSAPTKPAAKKRSDRDLLEEILEGVRSMNRGLPPRRLFDPVSATLIHRMENLQAAEAAAVAEAEAAAANVVRLTEELERGNEDPAVVEAVHGAMEALHAAHVALEERQAERLRIREVAAG